MENKIRKIFSIVLALLLIFDLSLMVANNIIKIKRNATPEYHYQFVSNVLYIKDSEYAVVSDEGHIYTFNTKTAIIQDTEYLITMNDKGTQINIDDEIVSIEIIIN